MGNRHAGGGGGAGFMRNARAAEEEVGSCHDPELRRRASCAVSAAAGAGVEVRFKSLGSLREVAGCVVEMNQEVVRVVLAGGRDVWGSTAELFDLVEDYFDVSLHTLGFLAALDESLRRARGSELTLHLALQRLDDDHGERTLRRFKAAREPFADEFSAAFQAVYGRQLAMTDKLRQQKRRLDRRLRSVRLWRRVTGVIIATAFAAILICSVVAAAVAAPPPVAAALAAAASLPAGSAGRWVDALLRRYQDALRGHREAVIAMQVGAFVAVDDLDAVRALLDRLELQMSSSAAERVVVDLPAARAVAEELLMKCVDELGRRADKCGHDIRRARTIVLQRIMYQKI